MTYLAKQLKNVDGDDIDDCIIQIEKTFAIKFNSDDLSKVNSLTDLTNLTISNLNIPQIDSCTSQQAFYKFSRAYLRTQNSNQKITPNSILEELFPKKNRREQIKSLEQELGFKLNMLEPPDWIMFSLIGLFILSFIMLFISTFYGVAGILMSIFAFYIAVKFGNVLRFNNVSEFIASIVQENYHLCRSSESYNLKEVERLIMQIFTENLDLDSSKFDSNTTFS